MANIAKDIIQLHVSKVSDPIWENVCIHFTFEDLKDGQTRKIMVKRQQCGKASTVFNSMTLLALNDIFQKKKVIQATRDGLFCISCFTRLILNKEYITVYSF